ncbi:MAG: hypothetical protein ACREA0_08470 [bacterium]
MAITVKGHIYKTIVDAANELGVSQKAVRSYIERRILPLPPTVRQGLREVQVFPVEYLAVALKTIANWQAGSENGRRAKRPARSHPPSQ